MRHLLVLHVVKEARLEPGKIIIILLIFSTFKLQQTTTSKKEPERAYNKILKQARNI